MNSGYVVCEDSTSCPYAPQQGVCGSEGRTPFVINLGTTWKLARIGGRMVTRIGLKVL